MPKRIVKISELAEILATTETAIRSHLQRNNYDAIPKPIRLGRRIVWSAKKVEEFIAIKERGAQAADHSKKMVCQGGAEKGRANCGRDNDF